MNNLELTKTTDNLLPPLNYHRDICVHLQTHEKGLWDWFASDTFTEKHIEFQKLELLKSTFRLTPESNVRLYELVGKACEALNIDYPITVYQGQAASDGLNAELMFFPGEIAIILRGDIVAKLTEEELLAVFSHEVSHHKLYTIENGQYFTAMRILNWCSSQPDCPIPFYETSRRYQLFTEVYADLGALKVTGQWQATISSLIKVTTGLSEIAVDDYLVQADEVLAQLEGGSQGISHPETYIRAKVLHTVEKETEWYEKTAPYIIGKLDAESLDLIDQKQLTNASKILIDAISQNTCMRTDTLEAMAQQYFPEYVWRDTPPDIDELVDIIANSKEKTLEYYCYLLLDFATADSDLHPVSMVVALELAQQLNIYKIFEPLFRKELKQKKDDVKKLLLNAQEQIEAANHARP